MGKGLTDEMKSSIRKYVLYLVEDVKDWKKKLWLDTALMSHVSHQLAVNAQDVKVVLEEMRSESEKGD